MTPADLDALEKLHGKATPVPWTRTASGDKHWLREVRDQEGNGLAWCGSLSDSRARANAALIVAAVNALPALLALAREAIELRERVAAAEVLLSRHYDGALDAERLDDLYEAHRALWPQKVDKDG
jgi:hypothetical protein